MRGTGLRSGDAPAQFDDRRDAGRYLAPLLAHLSGPGTVVLGLPRGGVPVAAEVAQALACPLDVIVVRKLGVPWQPELAMGAIGEGGVRVLNREVVGHVAVTDADFRRVEEMEAAELERRVDLFRGGRPMVDLAGKTAVIVDDGIATGSTAEAACSVARAHGAARVIMAAPVASPAAIAALRAVADDVVVAAAPARLGAIGFYYRDFTQITDREVRAILDEARKGERHGA